VLVLWMGYGRCYADLGIRTARHSSPFQTLVEAVVFLRSHKINYYAGPQDAREAARLR
jgi:hypothetical protein